VTKEELKLINKYVSKHLADTLDEIAGDSDFHRDITTVLKYNPIDQHNFIVTARNYVSLQFGQMIDLINLESTRVKEKE